jgi:ribosomal protein S18 acetylase RimI-like enzyme
MDDPAWLRPARERDGVTVTHAEVPLPALNRWMYAEIGRGHHWVDRGTWDETRWQAHVEGVETWLAMVRGTPAGMAELKRAADGSVDVHVFGILPPFQGQGVGGMLLTAAIRRGWEIVEPAGAQRVTVNTCALDGPHALDNYRARGFEVVREATEPRRRADGPVARMRGGRADERAALEALQLRASLVWEQYAEQLKAHREVVELPADERVRVAVDEADRPLGFSVVIDGDDGAWELDGLFVEPELQHAGIGRVLVGDVVGDARAAGVPHIDVVAGPARGFYEKLGFSVVGEAPTRFGTALAMRRPL